MRNTSPAGRLDTYRRWFFGPAILLLVLLFLVMTSGGAGSPLSIAIFVLDAKTGEPISKITVFLLHRDEQGAEHGLGSHTTNKSGAAQFFLQEPLPERIGISFSPDQAKSCSDIAFSVRDILNSGVLAKNDCDIGKPNVQVRPKAGVLIVFVSKVTVGERVRREIP